MGFVKTFQCIDNWFEERAEPLKGVLVDQGEVSDLKQKPLGAGVKYLCDGDC